MWLIDVALEISVKSGSVKKKKKVPVNYNLRIKTEETFPYESFT